MPKYNDIIETMKSQVDFSKPLGFLTKAILARKLQGLSLKDLTSGNFSTLNDLVILISINGNELTVERTSREMDQMQKQFNRVLKLVK